MNLKNTFTAAAVCVALSGCSANTTQGAFNRVSKIKDTYDSIRQIGGGKLEVSRYQDGAKITMKWGI